MAERVRVQAVSRANLGPLVEMAEHLRAALPGWQDTAPADGRSRPPSDLALDFAHLAHHDGDGFLVATVDDTVAGLCTAFVRSRTLSLTGIWILPEFQDRPVAASLIRRALAYGDRAGAVEACSLVLGDAGLEGELFRFGLRPRFPVYRLRLAAAAAKTLGSELARLLPGGEVSEDSVRHRTGRSDTERIDRLTRGLARPMDHDHWLVGRGLRVAMVRAGDRVAAYAYGGAGQCGPLAATTSDAALAALGWALQMAAADAEGAVEAQVPGVFEGAVEHLLEAGGRCLAAGAWMTRHPVSGMERCLLASTTIP
ncbi:MAG: GNAT family N-acetyltransferase [Acidobacteriota bacterium]|jgi:GNAT superfamily N-acetyltransferase